MIKAVFFDIDGTLLPHSTGKVPLSTERAVSRRRIAYDFVILSQKKYDLVIY